MSFPLKETKTLFDCSCKYFKRKQKEELKGKCTCKHVTQNLCLYTKNNKCLLEENEVNNIEPSCEFSCVEMSGRQEKHRCLRSGEY